MTLLVCLEMHMRVMLIQVFHTITGGHPDFIKPYTSVTLVLTMFSKSAKRQKTLQLAVLQFLATLTLKEYMKEYKCICVPLTM